MGEGKRSQVERRDSAVKLVDDLAGEGPAGPDFPVGTVDISGNGGNGGNGVREWTRISA